MKKKLVNKTPMTLIKYHCIDCSGGSPLEVKLCPVYTCPLYTVRPYKTDKERAAKVKSPKRQAQGKRLAELLDFKKKGIKE